ncbi:hypothetical protein [Paenibacillus sp. TSA_86.1]|uniref:hypothetical protein n=1 Tax=Paenibacillus sp. TSA_86.1 TaxID=3415649 RepID=UPI0040456673
MEIDYYKKYSADRYKNTEEQYLTILTPFRKQYLSPFNSVDEIFMRDNAIIDELVKHTLKIRRYDLLSRYHDHNNSPSVRCMRSCSVLFIYNNSAFMYDVYKDVMIKIADNISIGTNSTLIMIGLNDLLNLVRFYSGFSLYISTLDAGHVLYNIKHVLGTLAVPYQEYTQIGSKYILEQLPLDTSSMYVSFMIEIELSEKLKMDTNLQAVKGTADVRSHKKFNEISPLGDLKLILDGYAAETVSSSRRRSPNAVIPFLPLAETLNRSSAHSMVGNFNMNEKFERFDSAELMKLLHDSKEVLACPDVEYSLLVKNEHHTVAFHKNGKHARLESDFSKIMYNDHRFFDLKTYKFVLISYSKTSHIQQYGLRNLLLTCGEIMQIAGLYASSLGYAFRPMKNHNDEYIKGLLQLTDEYEVNYIGVVCNSSVKQFSLYL